MFYILPKYLSFKNVHYHIYLLIKVCCEACVIFYLNTYHLKMFIIISIYLLRYVYLNLHGNIKNNTNNNNINKNSK